MNGREFVGNWLRRDPDSLAAETQLYRDLGVAGDDAEELIRALEEHFSIAPPLKTSPLFPTEAECTIGTIAFVRALISRKRFEDLSIERVEAAAEAGAWVS